jgi:hypothetical protein
MMTISSMRPVLTNLSTTTIAHHWITPTRSAPCSRSVHFRYGTQHLQSSHLLSNTQPPPRQYQVVSPVALMGVYFDSVITPFLYRTCPHPTSPRHSAITIYISCCPVSTRNITHTQQQCGVNNSDDILSYIPYWNSNGVGSSVDFMRLVGEQHQQDTQRKMRALLMGDGNTTLRKQRLLTKLRSS